MIGWIIAGAVVGTALVVAAMNRFWDSIAVWLNNTAANAVEKVLGYNAKKFMQRAVTQVSNIRNNLYNKTVVYTRQSALDTHIHKVTLSSTAPIYEQEQEVKEQFEKENVQMNEFVYRK